MFSGLLCLVIARLGCSQSVCVLCVESNYQIDVGCYNFQENVPQIVSKTQ